MPPAPVLPGGAKWTGELAVNRLLDAALNGAQITSGRTRDAAALRTIFEPAFFQVLPRVDITTPVGLGYNFFGLSTVDPAMNRGTGDISIGATATLDQVWKGAITLIHYFGDSKTPPIFFATVGGSRSLADWDSIGVSVKRTF
jgi:hypothetical protein